MSDSVSGVRSGVFLWAMLASLAALVGAVMTAAAGPLYRHGLADLSFAFSLLGKGFWIGIAAGAAGLASALAALLTRRLAAVLPAGLAVVLGFGLSLWLYGMYRHARAVPPIHDIATDPAQPPQFIALQSQRKAAPNGLDYGGGGAGIATREQRALAAYFASPAGRANPRREAVAAACASWNAACLAAVQRAYYPGIVPLAVTGVSPDRSYAAALTAARAMGWKIAAADVGSRHIEATATTAWFGFKDDVAVDVAATADGSVVNVRSDSRLGLSDVGANAQRIGTYLHRLARRLGSGAK